MAFRAVIDEAGFERGLDARDSSFIDVGFFLFFGRYLDGKIEQLLTINQRDAQLLLLSCIDEHSLHLNWTLMTSVGPTRFERRISLRTALRSTARRGGACREAKDLLWGGRVFTLYVRPMMGRSAKTLWATSPTVREMRLSGRASSARRFKSAFERWPRYRGPTNMRRVRFVLWLRSAVPRHRVVTHKLGTTTARIIARDP